MLPDSLVRSTVVEVGFVFFDRPIEVALADDEAEVKALAADAAQESFANRVGLGCLERRPIVCQAPKIDTRGRKSGEWPQGNKGTSAELCEVPNNQRSIGT